jgi:hypothetical protein
MLVYRIPRALAVCLPLTLAACASAGPPPLEAGHPADPETMAAPVPQLHILSTYRDFTRPPAHDAGQAPPAAPAGERHDAHER